MHMIKAAGMRKQTRERSQMGSHGKRHSKHHTIKHASSCGVHS